MKVTHPKTFWCLFHTPHPHHEKSQSKSYQNYSIVRGMKVGRRESSGEERKNTSGQKVIIICESEAKRKFFFLSLLSYCGKQIKRSLVLLALYLSLAFQSSTCDCFSLSLPPLSFYLSLPPPTCVFFHSSSFRWMIKTLRCESHLNLKLKQHFKPRKRSH